MPHAIAFDTLAYAKRLMAVGVPQEQAEVQSETISEIIESEFATKRDIYLLTKDMKAMEVSLKRDMKEMDNSLKRDMKEMETSLQNEILLVRKDMKAMELRLKHDLTLRLGVMISAAIAIVAALVKLL